MNMNIKFSFWEVSFKGQVLTYKLTFKGAHRWMKKWMVENLNKHYRVLDQETDTMVDSDEVIYNGRDKVQIRECHINDERKSPEAIYNFTYYHTEN
jgi:hypothetical protein